MHSLLARDLADTVVRDRVRFAARRRAAAPPAATGCGCDIVPAGPVKAVIRPGKAHSPEAEPVCA